MTRVLWPSEKRKWTDEATGACLVHWTAHPAMHHHFYFTNPTNTADGETIFGVHYRHRHPNLLAIDTASGELRALTEQDDINAFSPTPTRDGSRIFYSARDEVRFLDVTTGIIEVLCKFNGGRLGNCSLSHGEKWLAVSRRQSTCELMLVNIETGQARCVVEKAEVGHIQFRPGDDSTLEYSGPPDARIWTVRADGSDDRLLYPQQPGEWIVHESWSAGGDEILFTHWPHALRAVSFPSGEVRTIAENNAWHAWSSPDGKRIVCDTNHPDRGLLLIDTQNGTHRVLCHSHASSQGTQWKQKVPTTGAGIDVSIIRSDDPAQDEAPHPEMPESTYGPQWTHPHPTFALDSKSVIFTSDGLGVASLTGWSQIYSVTLD